MRAGPPVMVNSCTGKMGHATAEAVVRAGLELIPYTFCGTSQGVAVGSIGVSGVPVERVSAERRDQVRSKVACISRWLLTAVLIDHITAPCHSCPVTSVVYSISQSSTHVSAGAASSLVHPRLIDA